jgi:hypothetical protein
MWIGLVLIPIWIRIGSASKGNLDPDPDRHQNDADPQHCHEQQLKCIYCIGPTFKGNMTQDFRLPSFYQ